MTLVINKIIGQKKPKPETCVMLADSITSHLMLMKIEKVNIFPIQTLFKLKLKTNSYSKKVQLAFNETGSDTVGFIALWKICRARDGQNLSHSLQTTRTINNQGEKHDMESQQKVRNNYLDFFD